MRNLFLLLSFVIPTLASFGQSKAYYSLVNKADSLFKAKQFERSGYAYSEAFKISGWKGAIDDRYNAACSWAMANYSDSSFFQLDRIATKGNYTDYEYISTDPNLNSLHDDKRWKPLLEIIKSNKDKAEANLNRPLALMLDSIFVEDQKYREQLRGMEEKYGWESREVQDHWKMISKIDSSNLVKVKAILDQYGWLGEDVVGGPGNLALFLVIQHSDQMTQEKYLPMMREAVKNDRASAANLALLEDRVALGQGKRQIYGSQISRDPETNRYYVRPLDNPETVDERRLKVGLQPLSEYVSIWEIKWDIEQYKKDLPLLEQKEKLKKQ